MRPGIRSTPHRQVLSHTTRFGTLIAPHTDTELLVAIGSHPQVSGMRPRMAQLAMWCCTKQPLLTSQSSLLTLHVSPQAPPRNHISNGRRNFTSQTSHEAGPPYGPSRSYLRTTGWNCYLLPLSDYTTSNVHISSTTPTDPATSSPPRLDLLAKAGKTWLVSQSREERTCGSGSFIVVGVVCHHIPHPRTVTSGIGVIGKPKEVSCVPESSSSPLLPSRSSHFVSFVVLIFM